MTLRACHEVYNPMFIIYIYLSICLAACLYLSIYISTYKIERYMTGRACHEVRYPVFIIISVVLVQDESNKLRKSKIITYLFSTYFVHRITSALAKWGYMSLLWPTYSVDVRKYYKPHTFSRKFFPFPFSFPLLCFPRALKTATN